jgi:hypothetical protein
VHLQQVVRIVVVSLFSCYRASAWTVFGGSPAIAESFREKERRFYERRCSISNRF